MAVLVETQEQIKRRKKGIGSENHSYLQSRLIRLIYGKYTSGLEVIPELSIIIDGKEKNKTYSPCFSLFSQ